MKYNTLKIKPVFHLSFNLFPLPSIISRPLRFILGPFGGAQPLGWEPLDLTTYS